MCQLFGTEALRKEARMRWMTLPQYISWSSTADGGFLSPQDAHSSWEAMVKDPKADRDSRGKDGALRLLIHISDDVLGYSEMLPPLHMLS